MFSGGMASISRRQNPRARACARPAGGTLRGHGPLLRSQTLGVAISRVISTVSHCDFKPPETSASQFLPEPAQLLDLPCVPKDSNP